MQALRQEKSKEIIDRIHDLATLPTIVTKVVSMMDVSSTTTGDIENVIKKDQVLTSKILKLVNSSFYGFSRKIDSISDAIVLLGFSALRNLIITSSIFNINHAGAQDVGTVIQNLWTHSVGCGITAKLISQKLRILDANEAFVAGILHDIGKVVICQHLKKEFKEIISLIRTEHISTVDAEERVLGTTHCEIGKCLAEKCNLPENLAEVIAHHHSPADASVSRDLVALVHIADAINASVNSESSLDTIIGRIDKYSLARLGLTEESAEDFLAELSIDLEDIDECSFGFIA